MVKCRAGKFDCWWHMEKLSSKLEVWKTGDFLMLVTKLANSIVSQTWQRSLEEEAGKMQHQY